MAVPGSWSALYLSVFGPYRWLVAPVLVVAMFAGAVSAAVPRSEGWIAFWGLLLSGVFLLASGYEMYLYSSVFCGGGAGATRTSEGDALCDAVSAVGHWPLFVPPLAVLLASVVAVERGRGWLAVGAFVAMSWSLLFLGLPWLLGTL